MSSALLSQRTGASYDRQLQRGAATVSLGHAGELLGLLLFDHTSYAFAHSHAAVIICLTHAAAAMSHILDTVHSECYRNHTHM